MQTAEDIARELERAIAEATASVETFVAAQSSAFSQSQHEHENVMREMEAKIQRLKRDHAATEERFATLQHQLSAEKRALSDRQADIARLESAAGALPAEVDTGYAKRDAAELQHAGAQQELEKTEASVRQQLLDFSKGLEAYKRLGLVFENVPAAGSSADAAASAGGAQQQNIRVVFTLLDERDPSRRFEFDVRVSPTDDSYAISNCSPPVHRLAELEASLNATNDFARFVQLMRREFKAVVRG